MAVSLGGVGYDREDTAGGFQRNAIHFGVYELIQNSSTEIQCVCVYIYIYVIQILHNNQWSIIII